MCQENKQQWLDNLPMVLLGLRTCLKEDLKCSSAEIVYGAPLRVPGEFVENYEQTKDMETFIIALCRRIRQLRPQPTAHHSKRTAFGHKTLEQATRVRKRRRSTQTTAIPLHRTTRDYE